MPDLPAAHPGDDLLRQRDGLKQTIVNAVAWSYCQPTLIADQVIDALAKARYAVVSRDDLAAVLDGDLTTLDRRPAAEKRLRAAIGHTVVYVAEVIWFGDDPVDGRTRVAVCASLDDALDALRERTGSDLVATQASSALGTQHARTWAVHRRDEPPSDEGYLWITEEPVRGRAAQHAHERTL